MNYFDITSGYRPQGSQYMGGLLGGAPQFRGMFGMPSQFSQLFGGGTGFRSPAFPQYGGSSRSAQMMNNYMGGLLSRRQGYQPPAMPMRQQPMAAAMFGNGYGTPYSPYFDMGGTGGLGEGVGAGPGGGGGEAGSGVAIGGFGEGFGVGGFA